MIILSIATVLFFSSLLVPAAFAQFQAGGVDKQGTWFLGEGLNQGDQFSYSVCHIAYKDCVKFEMDIWIGGNIQVGTETKWLANVVVYDGNKRKVGTMELGKVAPEPTGSSKDIKSYKNAFKSSIAWLSAFATSDGSSGGKGPKEFSAKSWGKIANIGGEQVLPQALETVYVPAGTWETVQIGWKTGGVSSKIWIVDDFPFPIKAKTFTHVSEGKAPVEYEFELLDYKTNVQENPFKGITSTRDQFIDAGCDTKFTKDSVVKKPTVGFNYQIHVFYGPDEPVQGCQIQWLIKFINKYDDTGFHDQIQFDILVVDEDLTVYRSLAKEEGRPFLFSPSGQSTVDMIIKEQVGIATYAIWIYGSAPEGIVPATPDYLLVNVPISKGNLEGFEKTIIPPATQKPIVEKPIDKNPTPSTESLIPAWIKDNAGWWADGAIDDQSFLNGLEYLIEKQIIKVMPTTQSSSDAPNEIPAWIKDNAGWWADGAIDDQSFLNGIKYLIEHGIISVS